MISVIVPTFNVDLYFDRCVDSIVNQTYKDFEVIIVDGNSSDGTIKREEKWMKKDSRVRRIFQNSKGLGPARDEGVRNAKGEYITFIDSDDWWDLTYLEKMHRAIVDCDAEIAMCDRLNYHFNSQGEIVEKYAMTKPIMFDHAMNFSENPEILNMIEVSSNGKLYKRDLFLRNSIVTPNSAAEDRAVLHYLIWKASKIVKVFEPLYFYHAQRGGSLVNTVKAWKSIPICLDVQFDYFANDNNFDHSLEASLRTISIDTALAAVDSIRPNMAGEQDSEALELIDTIENCHKKRYPDLFDKQYIIGSYSLRREVWLAYHSFEEIRIHQQFSSVISLMSAPIDKEVNMQDIKDSNRKKWLENDFNKSFMKVIDPSESDYVFIDFLEERYDIGKLGESYFTWSELYETENNYDKVVERLDRLSDEVDTLFKDACRKFICCLLEVTSPDHIILVRNHLSLKHGVYTGTVNFLNQERLQAINEKIDQYYDFFIDNCPGSIVINPREEKSFFSYEGFPYGCTPYHINDGFYHNVAYELRSILIR